MLRRDSPTPREHMSERLWMRDRMTLLHSVCHHHEFVKTSHRGSHETCSPQVLTEPRPPSETGYLWLQHHNAARVLNFVSSWWKTAFSASHKLVGYASSL